MKQSRRTASRCLVILLTAGFCAAPAAAQTSFLTLLSAQPHTATTTTQATTQTSQGADERLPFMEQTHNENEAEAPSAAGLLARTFGALLLIVGLLAALAWGLRRFGGAQLGREAEDAPELAVLATISLGDRRSLSAVRFGDRLLLLGSTAQAITLLAAQGRRPRHLPPPRRSVAELLAADEPRAFEQALNRASERLEERADTKTADTKTADTI
jgi:flagellar biosynthetic protein FliO